MDENNIKFVSVSDADKWIEDNELVLVLEYKDVKRVYPLQILVWHEIANDVVAGDPSQLLIVLFVVRELLTLECLMESQ